MDLLLSGLLIRFFERITVVLIGGMSIYLGFRLFRDIPEHRDSAGNLVLPWDISIKLTRVGPGVFFALFGVASVSLSLLRPLEIVKSPGQTENNVEYSRFLYANPSPSNRDARTDERKLLTKHFAVLNNVLSSLKRDLSDEDRNDIEFNIREIKLKLMEPAWGDPNEGFGDFGMFENWVRNGDPSRPPEGMEGCWPCTAINKEGTSP